MTSCLAHRTDIDASTEIHFLAAPPADLSAGGAAFRHWQVFAFFLLSSDICFLFSFSL